MDSKAVIGAIETLLVEAYVVADNRLAFFVLHVDQRGQVQRPEWFSRVSSLSTCQGSVGDGGISISELQGKVDKTATTIGMDNRMKKKWIKKDGGEKSGDQRRQCPKVESNRICKRVSLLMVIRPNSVTM